MADERAEAIRRHIGTASPPTDAELIAAYDRLGSAEAVALPILETRLADMVDNPAKWSVDGDFDRDHTENLKALRAKVAELQGIVPDASGDLVGHLSTARMVRAGRGR